LNERSNIADTGPQISFVNVSDHGIPISSIRYRMVLGHTVPYGVPKRLAEKSVTPAARLTKNDWIGAAIDAIEHGGIAGIAVEPIAIALETTKGSFYWHFTSRDELIDAVMQRWEDRATNAVIASIAEIADPMDRLRQLLRVVFGHEREDRIEARIVLAPFDARISPTVDRVTTLRIEFLISLFRGLGFSRSTAAKRARIAYAAYLGHLRLLLDDKQSSSAATRSYADELLKVLTFAR
jgi:AcrR family transcriptional regulator